MLRNSFLPLKRRWPMTTSKIKDTRILESLLCRGQRWAGNKPGFFSHSPHTPFHTTRTKRKLTYPKLGHWIEKRIVLLLKLPNKCDALGLYRSVYLGCIIQLYAMENCCFRWSSQASKDLTKTNSDIRWRTRPQVSRNSGSYYSTLDKEKHRLCVNAGLSINNYRL